MSVRIAPFSNPYTNFFDTILPSVCTKVQPQEILEPKAVHAAERGGLSEFFLCFFSTPLGGAGVRFAPLYVDPDGELSPSRLLAIVKDASYHTFQRQVGMFNSSETATPITIPQIDVKLTVMDHMKLQLTRPFRLRSDDTGDV